MKILVKRPLVRLILECLAVVGVYVLSARIIPHTGYAPATSSPLWPPAGIAVAVGLVLGYRSAIGVWLGALLVDFDLLAGPYGPATATAVASGVTCQMLATTLLLRRFVPHFSLQLNGVPDHTYPPSMARDILRFIVVTAISSVISPSLGLLSLKAGGFISWNDIESLWIKSWVSNYAGILTVTPLLVVGVLSWRKRNIFEPIVFPITTLCLGLSFIVSYVVWQNETLTAADRLRQDGQQFARQFERNIERTLERLQAIEGLLVASEPVSREHFRSFVSRLVENDKPQRPFQWVPRVKLAERKNFEERARREGMAGFAIFEWNALGERLDPGLRAEYFPLLFAEPRAEHPPDMGLDLASAPGVLAILNSARDSGRVTATLSGPSPPQRSDQREIFLYHPVYMNQMADGSLAERREHMRGFVRIEVPIAEWVRVTLVANASRPREIFVFDVTDEDEPLFLASSTPGSAPRNESLPIASAQELAQLRSGTNQAAVIDLGGRQLLYLVRPGPGQSGLDTVWDALGIMAIGALITAALIIYLRMRDQALGKMQNAEKHYRELFEAAPAMYVTTRDDRGVPIISDCNELFLKTLKYERKDVIGRSLGDFHSPESRIKLLSANGYPDAMEGKIVSGDRELLVSDGRTVPVLLRGDPIANDQGKIIGTRAMYVDNSEQKFAEEQMRLVVESAPNGMIMIDKNGLITLVNRHVEQLFGYRREELLGKPVEFLIPHRFRGSHPQQREEFFKDARARMMGNGQELFALKRDASEIPVEIGLNPIHTRRGMQVLASVVDVTERRRAEGEIRALNVTLERRVAERTEEIQALNAGLEQRVADRTKEIEAENAQRKLIERELQRAHDELQRSVLELEQRNQEMRLVGEMVELLESCRSPEEAYGVVTRGIVHLLQDTSGALYMITLSRNMLEIVGRWGEPALAFEKIFDPEDCWALRRNKPHGIESEGSDLICKHVESAGGAPEASLCIPMVAHGEVMGLLHIRYAGQNTSMKSVIANSAKAATEQLSVILANLRLRDTLRNQTFRDPQTGLFNRRYMEDSLDRELSRAERSGKPVVVAMLDIDHFKHLNDNYGHSAGDAVLREWSNLLKSKFRGSDIVCRYGGEEFVIILPEISLDNARPRLEQLRQDLRRVVVRQDGQIIDGVTVSMGIAYYPVHGRTNQSLIETADKALYRAKELGRDCIVTASEEAHDDTVPEWAFRAS